MAKPSLSDVYPIVLIIDVVNFYVRDNGFIWKPVTYVILGINEYEIKEVLNIDIGENESRVSIGYQYWIVWRVVWCAGYFDSLFPKTPRCAYFL